MNVHAKGSKLVRCALLCVACDIPACRKVVGFLGHSATLDCSNCLKKFPGSVGCKDYSDFDMSKWPPRTNEQHRKDVKAINACKTKSKKSDLESSLGSVLLDLPYFDPVRMAIIDPMHNLYLGTAKHIVKKVWHERGMIDKKDYGSLQECVDSVCSPPSLGRLPLKILSSFSGLTADQLQIFFHSLLYITSLHQMILSAGDTLYYHQASFRRCSYLHLIFSLLMHFCCSFVIELKECMAHQLSPPICIYIAIFT